MFERDDWEKCARRQLTEAELEFLEERAAIAEFCGGCQRGEAENQALEELKKKVIDSKF